MKSVVETFDALPRRLFLDSCTVQTIGDYGAYLWEGEPPPEDDRLHKVPDGWDNLQALRSIFLVNERAQFEWMLSDASMSEAEARRDSRHMRWVLDVLDHTSVCLEESGGEMLASAQLSARLAEPKFNYLSSPDRALIADAVRLRCDAFLTMERRLRQNAEHLSRELGLQVLEPKEYWGLLQPWAALYR